MIWTFPKVVEDPKNSECPYSQRPRTVPEGSTDSHLLIALGRFLKIASLSVSLANRLKCWGLWTFPSQDLITPVIDQNITAPPFQQVLTPKLAQFSKHKQTSSSIPVHSKPSIYPTVSCIFMTIPMNMVKSSHLRAIPSHHPNAPPDNFAEKHSESIHPNHPWEDQNP